eukprot:gene4237-biopygen6748
MNKKQKQKQKLVAQHSCALSIDEENEKDVVVDNVVVAGVEAAFVVDKPGVAEYIEFAMPAADSFDADAIGVGVNARESVSLFKVGENCPSLVGDVHMMWDATAVLQK